MTTNGASRTGIVPAARQVTCCGVYAMAPLPPPCSGAIARHPAVRKPAGRSHRAHRHPRAAAGGQAGGVCAVASAGRYNRCDGQKNGAISTVSPASLARSRAIWASSSSLAAPVAVAAQRVGFRG
jgi:hypothetical protein